MSRGAKLSIMGLYNYNTDVFAGFEVPDGMDKDVVINEIVMQCAELELLYPSYNLMKIAIANWTKVEAKIWEKLWATENLEYNPIWNVDGKVIEKGNAGSIGSTKGYNETNWLDNSKLAANDERETIRTGNIGVTTTQQMIREEREVAEYSTVWYIVNSFKKRFCLMVY